MRLVPRLLPAVLAALTLSSASAQSRREGAFDLVQLDVSARTAALAGAAGGLSGTDPTALFSNPAFLTAEMNRSAALGYVNHLTDINAGSVVYARTLGRLGVDAAASVRYLSYGDFERDAGTGAGETYGAGEAAITLTASRVVAPRVRVGGSASALFATIDDASAQALTADVGATYEVPSQGLVVGLGLNNVGTVLNSLGTVEDSLALDLRLTLTKRLRYIPLTVTLAGYELHRFDGPETDSSFAVRALDHLAVGGELRLGRVLTTRAGYNPRRGRALRSGGRLDLAGASVGFGLAVRRFALDYAYSNWSESGGLHQIGVRTRL